MRWDILEEHLDEAAFLWSRWEQVLVAPHYTLAEVAGLEARLLAHLDGLVLGGPAVAARLLEPALESEEPERACAAALCLLAEENNPDWGVISRWFSKEIEQVPAPMLRALMLCGRTGLQEQLSPLLKTHGLLVQAAIVELLASRRVGSGRVLEQLVVCNEPAAQVAALRAAARVPVPLASGLIRQGLESPIPSVRDAALEAGLVLGIRDAWSCCLRVAREHEPQGRFARVLLALGGEEEASSLLVDALGRPELREDALWAVGFSGRIALADACVQLLRDARCARLAGEAFSAITGLVLQGAFVVEPPEEEEPIPPEQESLDADLSLKPEGLLPMPKAEAVEEWWVRSRKGLDPRVRYLQGKPFSSAALLEQLEDGPMRRRAVHALELSIRSQGVHVVRVWAFTRMQRRDLEQARKGRSMGAFAPFAALVGRA